MQPQFLLTHYGAGHGGLSKNHVLKSSTLTEGLLEPLGFGNPETEGAGHVDLIDEEDHLPRIIARW